MQAPNAGRQLLPEATALAETVGRQSAARRGSASKRWVTVCTLDVHFVNSLPLLEVARVLKPFIFKGSKLAQDL
jgi:hypothetical protein